jgi:SAM-dependent methyltransferase
VWEAGVHADLEAPLGQAMGERGDARRGGADLGRVVVREEQDVHELMNGGDLMGSGEKWRKRVDDGELELERIEHVYAGYREDPRKRRAWSADNAGNVCMREEALRALLELAPQALQGDGRLLDAGCGAGWWLARLHAEGVPAERLLGVDLLESRVQAARARLPSAHVLQGDVRRLPVASASCSLVILFTVLSAMGSRGDVRVALGEARRVLAEGGAIAIWEPRVPAPNRHTRLIGVSELQVSLGRDLEIRSLTLAPPLARRVGGGLYGCLVRVPVLRTHRFVVARP